MANKFTAFFSRGVKKSQKAVKDLDRQVDGAVTVAKDDIKQAASASRKAAVSTGRAVKATATTTAKTVSQRAQQTAKSASTSVKKTAKTARTVSKAVVADVKKDIALATKPNSTWSVPQLREAARKKGLTGYSSMTKPQLLKALGAK